MARSFRSFRRPRQHQGHDETAGGPLLYHWRPLRALTALFSFRTAPGMDSPHVFQPEPAVQNPDHKRDSIVTRNVIWYSELGKIGRAHSELQSLMRISYAVFCLKKKTNNIRNH